jgi:hypothetical protein
MDRPSQAPIMRRRARAEPTPRVCEEQAKHQGTATERTEEEPKKNQALER